MHDNVKNIFSKWVLDHSFYIDNSHVADLGSYDINGSVKSFVSHAVGFDIYNGLALYSPFNSSVFLLISITIGFFCFISKNHI